MMNNLKPSFPAFAKGDLEAVEAPEEAAPDVSVGEENHDNEVEELAAKENRWVFWLRVLTTVVLVIVAVGACLCVYFQGKQAEQDDFEQDFLDLAEKLVTAFSENFNNRFGAVENFASELTTEEIGGSSGEWPFFTPRDWEIRATGVGRLAHLMMLILSPYVTLDQREQWDEYANANQGWKAEGLAYALDMPLEEVNAKPVFPTLTNAHYGGPPKPYEGPGPLWPLWNSWPAANTTPINLNLYANAENVDAMDLAYDTGKTALVRSYDYWEADPEKLVNDPRYILFKSGELEYLDDPFCLTFTPVFDKLGKGDKTVVALMMTVIYWRTYFDGRLPPGSNGVVVVLENTCDQQFTYQIENQKAYFVGHGDLHDTQFDYLGVSLDVVNRNTDNNATESIFALQKDLDKVYPNACEYTIRAYPSVDSRSFYETKKPMAYALVLAALFLFTSAVFVFYDYMVERRQRIVLKSAEQSGQLVSSLYPKEVREKLYQEQERARRINQGKDAFQNPDLGLDSKQAIAQLYPETTIIFADLVGFTKWSSSRTPVEVFHLLESLYGAFDAIAHRRRVYKIETIGDCYVAATGLPSPQKEHAAIMCRFATECFASLKTVTAELAESLGEDTSRLDMRVGLHSGSVTAGVLRGLKGRFQLFGDTINTASRMESKGVPGRIHVSQATADALTVCGKGEWLTPREDTIVAKGKGEMKTYFVTATSGAGSVATGSTCSGDLWGRAGSSMTNEDDKDATVLSC